MSKRYLITAAQNATEVHKGFWKSLQVAAKHLSAEILVIPLVYRGNSGEHLWWDDLIETATVTKRIKLGPNLVLVGDVRISPTAVTPLSGFEALTGHESCILGHTKLQLRSIAAPSNKMAKTLTTTGACTVPNYTDTKAGALGEFHHCLGATLAIVKGREFRVRQINADSETGAFIDLNKMYTPTGVQKAPPALALTMGDVHARFNDPSVDQGTFGPGGLLETVNAQHIIWHDTHDGYACNPHHQGNPFIAQAKFQAGFSSVKEEVEFTVDFVESRTKNRQSVIVPSNHDDFLSRWILSTDWRTASPINQSFYLETAQAMLAGTKMTPAGAEYPDPFVYWVNKLKKSSNIRCLTMDESFVLKGVEYGLHGNKGPNGSRGSLANLSKIGSKAVIGHTHSPGILNGTVQTGTNTLLRLEYTHGPSSWLQTDCVQYGNGKRTLITFIDGEWDL